MSKENQISSPSYYLRKKNCKSTDLKRRLFQVGISNNSFLPPPLVNNTLASNMHTNNQLKFVGYKPLKYQPSHSPPAPTILKTTLKDFQIRKSPKQPYSPSSSSNSKQNPSLTSSNFYKPDIIVPDPKQLKQMLVNLRNKQWDIQNKKQEQNLKLDQYVNLILRGVQHIDQFLYLVRNTEENIYELNLVNFQYIRLHQGESNFQYYTVSKKGFCQYVGGKPQSFLDLLDWAQEKHLYLKIKALKFFYRFRRWKTLQMWRRTVIRQRRQIISHNLNQRMFLLEPITRKTILDLRKLTLEMQKSVLIIARNEGTYSLQSFKHCQQKARRQASLAVQEYSRQSRAIVRKCFQNRLFELRQNLKKTAASQQKTLSSASQSPKQGAFQALGFPSKMTYEHRSRLRKQAGKFLRFSYLIDSLNLSCLTQIYTSQVNHFINLLQQFQYGESIKLRQNFQVGKQQAQRQKMFIIQLLCSFKQVPSKLKLEMGNDEWSPISDIRLRGQEVSIKQYVPKLTDYWLSLQPNFDQILDQLGFLLKEGLGSLKCFERWARHREMQKYVSILEQWDDFVSDNWQISQNDNLDPLILLDSIDPSLKKLKEILKFTENKFIQFIRNILNKLLNSYWQYTESFLPKLYNHKLLNPADTFQNILAHTTSLIDTVTHKVPHRLQLGVFTIQVTKLKNMLSQKFTSVIEDLRHKLPQLIEQRTKILNDWFSFYGLKLKQQIMNIDDFVKTVEILKEIDSQFTDKREQCNQLAQTYQIMQQFKIDTRKRKQFQTVTLKLKDQLDQWIITVQQNIQRKSDAYSKEVIKYHLPCLAKDIAKALQKINQSKFLQFSTNRTDILEELSIIKKEEESLFEQNQRCQKYLLALKLQPQPLQQLWRLSKEIKARIDLWKNLCDWERVFQDYEHKLVKEIPLKQLMSLVNDFRSKANELAGDLPQNQVLQSLLTSVNSFYIHLPLLVGFNQPLSQSHWTQIYGIITEKYGLDLKKRQFTMGSFLKSGIGLHVESIKLIFQKCKIQIKLQKLYHELQESWSNIIVRTKVEGRFSIIANGQDLRNDINDILISITELISNEYAQSLKQYSITYESTLAAQDNLQTWLTIQQKIVEIDRQCRVLDLKKMTDYNYFQNAERAYKQINKPMLSKGAEGGVKLNKLFIANIEENFTQIIINLQKVEENICNILQQHRRAFPVFYLFNNKQLLSLITDHNDKNIEWAARTIVPFISYLAFQNQRIISIVSMDQDKLIKNPISTNSDIQQILYQIIETTGEINKKNLKSCKYKAVENNLSSLLDQYNIQHLLAISRVDFSHYTTISIDNQQQTPDSLSQFRKVMKKDTMQDIKRRRFDKGSKSSGQSSKSLNLQKYDTLLLQQLFYEQILEQLIKKNVQTCQEFEWTKQLKFYWQDTNAQQSNITVRQLNLNIKYGNQSIGSKTKVIIQNEPQIMLGLKLSENIVYNGSLYTAERFLNALGYKINSFSAAQVTTQIQIKRFIIGSHYADCIPFLTHADLLSNIIINKLSTQKWIQEFKYSTLKRNSPYVKQVQRNSAVYLTLRQNSIGVQSFQGLMRVINYVSIKNSLMHCQMKLLGIYSQEKTNLLLGLFETSQQLQSKSKMKNISIEQFLDKLLCQKQIDESIIFSLALSYLKCKVSLQTYSTIKKYLQNLGLLPLEKLSIQKIVDNKQTMLIEGLIERRIMIVTGKGYSKKFFITKELMKRSIKIIQIYGKCLNLQSLIAGNAKEFFQNIFKSHDISISQPTTLYLQVVDLSILYALQKLMYGRMQVIEEFMKNQIYILIDATTLQRTINPKLIASFAIMNYQEPKQYTHALISQRVSFVGQQNHKAVQKIIFQIILPAIQSLTPKDQLAVEQKVLKFLLMLQSLTPFTNNLQACLYSLIHISKCIEEDMVKLQYILKKYISQQRLRQNNKITNLVYSKYNNGQSLVTEQNFMVQWMQRHQKFNKYHNYILTPEIAHVLHDMQNIKINTKCTPIIQGRANTCKTTILQIFRSINYQNTFFMQVSPAHTSKLASKLVSSLERHGLNILGARITFNQTCIIVEDVHLAQKQSLFPLQYMMNYNRCKAFDRQFILKNVRFALSSHKTQLFNGQNCLKLYLTSNKQKLNHIFAANLRHSLLKQWNINETFVKRILYDTFQICKKVLNQKDQNYKTSFTVLNRLISSYRNLKLKQINLHQKQIQKYWLFSLKQNLKCYATGQSASILQQQLCKIDIQVQLLTPLSYTHLICKPTQKKVQFLKDSKRLYNMLNEKIERYNEGQIKRYGQNFQFLNFDSVIQKIISISHSLLIQQDHLLIGRKGAGKESLVKLSAYLNGLLYKRVSSKIGATIIDIINNQNSPHLLYVKLQGQQDIDDLQQYVYGDFESDILGCIDNRPKTGHKDKEKNLHLRSTHNRNGQNNQYFTVPKTKLTQQEILAYKKSFRLVVSTTSLKKAFAINANIRYKFYLDMITEVPLPSILQYNEKLLAVDGVTCSKNAHQTLSQIYEHSRQKLGISLRGNDDCVRIFSSFLANLISQMSTQSQKYQRVLTLFKRLKNSCLMIQDEIEQLHTKLKNLSQTNEMSKQTKVEIQWKLRQKSTCLSVGQKLTDILSWAQNLYEQRSKSLNNYLQVRENIETCFAVTSSYFIYLSNLNYEIRQQILQQWYHNVPILKQINPITSFLPLFLLYEHQFNTEPIDHLPDFYQNMSIIFHSAKPIAIRDNTLRGRQWLIKNCSFIYLKESQKDFLQFLIESLTKSNNIIIQVNNQQTMDQLLDTVIGTLLFLPEDVSTVMIQGEEFTVHSEAKVYMLVGKDVIIPKHLQIEFTVVLFDQTKQLVKALLDHEYLSYNQREVYQYKLDLHKKIRTLRLECQNFIGQIAQSIYEQLCGSDQPADEQVLSEKLNKINDKIMIKIQNQFTKIKEKQELITDLQQKYDKNELRINLGPSDIFHQKVTQIRQILRFLSANPLYSKYHHFNFQPYFQTIRMALAKGFIQGISSLFIFALRHWGSCYHKKDYLLFGLLLVIASRGGKIQELAGSLTQQALKTSHIMTLLGKQKKLIHSQIQMQQVIVDYFVNLCLEQGFNPLNTFSSYRDNLLIPLVWLGPDNFQNNLDLNHEEVTKIIRILSDKPKAAIKEYFIQSKMNVLEPNSEETIEMLVKRDRGQMLRILVHDEIGLQQGQRSIKSWFLGQKSIILIHNNTLKIKQASDRYLWQVQLQNNHSTFRSILQTYEKQLYQKPSQPHDINQPLISQIKKTSLKLNI